MSHALIHTGGGWRCLKCGTNWDQGEETGDECLPDTIEQKQVARYLSPHPQKPVDVRRLSDLS